MDQLIESGYERFTIDAVTERSFNNRRSRIVGLIAARLGAYYDQAATPETLTEIVDDVFLPLAKNFGKSSLPST